jgi:hypothetical protein
VLLKAFSRAAQELSEWREKDVVKHFSNTLYMRSIPVALYRGVCEYYLYLHAERGVVRRYGGGGQVGQTEGSTAVDIHHLITPPGYTHTHTSVYRSSRHRTYPPSPSEHSLVPPTWSVVLNLDRQLSDKLQWQFDNFLLTKKGL